MPLKNRQMQIPGGMRFYQPETKWSPARWSSFDSICAQLRSHRNANPALAKKHNWNLEPELIAWEVDRFNSKICEQMGWTDYLTTGGAATARPFPSHRQLSLLEKSRALAAGASVLVDWVRSREDAVPANVSASRASTCAHLNNGKPCPRNTPGDWTAFFTTPASEAIKRELEKRRDMQLETPFDDELHVCDACLCPLKLKVHVPIDRIWSKLLPESKAALAPGCWILSETNPHEMLHAEPKAS